MSARWSAAFVLVAWSALAQSARDPGTAAIEGTVVDSVTSRPIRKAEVTLRTVPPPLDVSTDGSGHFAFRSLLAGFYPIEVKRAGYRTSYLVSRVEPGERSKVEIPLAPLGIVSGRVVEEDGTPVARCGVQAWQLEHGGTRQRLELRGNSGTTEAGEYRMELERGRYYFSASCYSSLPAPHPLMAVSDPRTPSLEIVPQFYPGVPGPSGATRVGVMPGAEVQGIDFRMGRTLAWTLAGRLDATDPSALSHRARIALRPTSPEFDGGPAEPVPPLDEKGTFRIAARPGSYLLVARTTDAGRCYNAQQFLEITRRPPDPVHLMLAPCPDVSGTLEVEGENAPAVESLQVSIHPLDYSLGGTETPAHVNKDGTFTLAAVAPGPWRLSVSGEAYVKSLTIGGTEASPYGFEVGPGGAGSLKIVLSTRTGQVSAAVSSPPGESGQVTYILALAELDALGSGLDRTLTGNGNGVTFRRVAPGRYLLFAFEAGDGSTLQLRPGVLKALESRAQRVEVAEGETVQATAEPIEARQLKAALDENQ